VSTTARGSSAITAPGTVVVATGVLRLDVSTGAIGATGVGAAISLATASRTVHFWLAPPWHGCTASLAPLTARPPQRSRHLPLTAVRSSPAAVRVHFWFAPAWHVNTTTGSPSLARAPATSRHSAPS
jgi:hypothetical protein